MPQAGGTVQHRGMSCAIGWRKTVSQRVDHPDQPERDRREGGEDHHAHHVGQDEGQCALVGLADGGVLGHTQLAVQIPALVLTC